LKLRRTLIVIAIALLAIPAAVFLAIQLKDDADELSTSLRVVLVEQLDVGEYTVAQERLDAQSMDSGGIWKITLEDDATLDSKLAAENYRLGPESESRYFRGEAGSHLATLIPESYVALAHEARLGPGSICVELECNVVVLRASSNRTIYVFIWKI
jgi:hypothetical protein